MHLARMYVLLMNGTDETLNHFYAIRWTVLPNLAMDVLVPPVGHIAGIETAGKLFLSFTLVLIFTGTFALHHAVHREWSAWPLLASLLLYNPYFLWGFVNFLFGLGCALWLSAGWIHLRENAIAWLLFPILTLALFFMHLMPFGIYMVFVAAYETGYAIRERSGIRRVAMRCVQLATQAAAPAILFLVASPTRGTASGALFSELSQKLAAFRHLFANYSPVLDFKLTFLPLCGLLLLGLVTRKVRIDGRLAWPLSAMLLVYIALPHMLLTSSGGFRRFTLPIALLLIASTDWVIQARNVRRALLAFFGVLLVGRTLVVEQAWLEQDKELTTYRSALDNLPIGARLYPAFIFPQEASATYRTHFPSMAVLDRKALVPSMFASEHQQPMLYQDRVKTAARGRLPARNSFSYGRSPDWALLSDFDYVLLTGKEHLREELPRELSVITSTQQFSLYSVRRSKVQGDAN